MPGGSVYYYRFAGLYVLGKDIPGSEQQPTWDATNLNLRFSAPIVSDWVLDTSILDTNTRLSA